MNNALSKYQSISVLLLLGFIAALSGCDQKPQADPKAGEAKVLQALPDFPLVGLEPMVKEQFRKAIQSVNSNPNEADASGNLGMIFHAYGYHINAKQCYERAIKLDSGNWKWNYYLGLVLAENGEWLDASLEFDIVLNEHPDDVPALMYQADAFRQHSRLEKALTGYRRVIELEAESAIAHYGAARALVSMYDIEKALEHLNRAVKISPDYGSARYLLGQTLRKSGRHDEAREQLQLAQKYHDDSPPLRDPLAAALDALKIGANELLHRGIEKLQAGKIEESILLLKESISIEPDLPEAIAQLGAAYLQKDQYGLAKSFLHRAIEIDPDYADALYNLGLIAHREKDLPEAVMRFMQVVNLRPEHFDAHLGLGIDLIPLGKTKDAIAHLNLATAIRPMDHRPYRRLGTSHTTLKQYAEAIRALEKGHKRLPEDLTITYRLAWILATCPDEKLLDAQRALELSQQVCLVTGKKLPQPLDAKAAALASLGRFDEAVEIAIEAKQSATDIGDQSLAEQIDTRIELYGKRQSYRQ